MVEFFTDISGYSDGELFRPKEHADAIAIVMHRIQAAEYRPKGQCFETAICDIAVFNTAAQLSGQDQPVVQRNATVTGKAFMSAIVRCPDDGWLVVAPRPAQGANGAYLTPQVVRDPATLDAIQAWIAKGGFPELGAAPTASPWGSPVGAMPF